MSGAGKSTAMKMLEDFGYFCVDNLPIALIKKFADLSFDSKGKIDKVALGVDIRSGNVNDLERVLDEIPQKENHEFRYRARRILLPWSVPSAAYPVSLSMMAFSKRCDHTYQIGPTISV